MVCCPIVLLILCSLNVMTTSAPWASEKPLGASQRSIEAGGGVNLGLRKVTWVLRKVTGAGRIGEILGGLREVTWSSRDIGPRDVNLGPIEVRNESSLKTTKVLQHEAAMLSKIQRSFSFFPFGILCKQ